MKLGHLLPNSKVKMGWYKVLKAHFDFSVTFLNSSLSDIGWKEQYVVAVPLGSLHRVERDARTM